VTNVTAAATGELIDLPTAARRLGISRRALNLLVLDGRVRARKLGQRWVISSHDFDEFVPTYQRRHGLPPEPEVAYPALRLLGEQEGATVAHVSAELGIKRRRALEWLQRLEADGLIERRRGSNPNQPARCYLTTAGRDFYRKELAGQEPRTEF
jgi:excisionase family DNA binding protein